MLGVEDVYVLRRKVLVEGKSQREVAREMGLARDTVRRYLATPVPEPQKRKRSRPVLEQVRPRLEQLTEEWSERTTAKQRITGRRLHRALREEGYDVGVSLVLEYLREWRRKRAEVYVPLVHRPGDEAQVDFFEVVVELAGVRSKAWLFLMRLMHSGRDFVRLYERQDQLSFLDGHVRAFAHVGGVPQRTVYDNLSAAVRRVQFPRRALTDRFQALVSHYCVEPCFARPGEGHDKGGVESRGRGVRLQVLTPIPRGDSLQDLSEEMQGEVDRLASQQVWGALRRGGAAAALPAGGGVRGAALQLTAHAADVGAHRRLGDRRAVLIDEALPDPPRRVPLLARRAQVGDKPLPDDLHVRTELRRRSRRLLALRRQRRLQRLPYRAPVHVVAARQLAYGQPLLSPCPSDILEQLHPRHTPLLSLGEVSVARA